MAASAFRAGRARSHAAGLRDNAPRMPEPARQPLAAHDAPEVDPLAIPRTLRRQRAKREARLDHKRDRRHAHVRFLVVVILLLSLTLLLVLTVWRQVERLFGL